MARSGASSNSPANSPQSKPTRILGVDPGLNITGYGVIALSNRRPELVEAGVIRGKAGAPLATRLEQIYRGLCDVIESLQPTELALEQLYSHYERPRTAILMGHARGVICLAGQLAGLEVHSYASTQVKKMLTGNGRAPKAQIQLAIAREFSLREAPDPPDVADALAIAMTHYYLVYHGAATIA